MKQILKISILFSVIMSFTSCFTDLLDPVPKTSISDVTAFDTKDRIVGQVNGLYSSFKDGQYLGGRYLVYNDIRNDDYLNLQQNGVTGLLTWGHNVTPSTNEVQNLWGSIYTAINRVNMFIEGMDENKDKILSSKLLAQTEFDQFYGEALALRGLAYFHLSQLYARPYKQGPNGLGMILRLKANRSPAENNLARSSVGDTYKQILDDLNNADNLLPVVTGANTVNTVIRINKSSVAAIKSRVYLHMENWDKVIEEANKIVSASAPFKGTSGVNYSLVSNFGNIFATPYVNSETVFSVPMTATELPGTQNGIAHYFSAATVGNNEYPINVASKVWSSTLFPADDARRLLTSTSVVGGKEYIFLKKYPTSPHTDWVPVIRYAEVLLNLAEAEAMKNGVNDRAVALLNAVFQRSNATAPAYVVADFVNKETFVNRVLLERNMEFLGEGIRNMDTMRKLAPHDAKATVGAVQYTSIAYIWPIPQSEINTNSLVEQNP